MRTDSKLISNVYMIYVSYHTNPFYQRISSSKQYKVDTVQRHSEDSSIVFAPVSWDWRSKGAVGPVQDQGQLGDAQAIVAAGRLFVDSLLTSSKTD